VIRSHEVTVRYDGDMTKSEITMLQIKEENVRSITRIVIYIVVLGVCFSSIAFADPVVVNSKGKYVMGDLDSKKDARSLALMEAKRHALERAGTYLESRSEVKNYELDKDQINSLAAGIISVEILNEDWKMSGENLMLTISIRAMIDTSNLDKHINELKEDDDRVEEFKQLQAQLATLQKELAALKSQKTVSVPEPKKELEQKHTNLIKELTAIEYLEKANVEKSKKNWKEALVIYEKAIAVNPDMSEAHIGRAIALAKTGNKRDALTTIDYAILTSPDNARAHAVKAWIMMKMKKYENALNSINRAIQLNNNFPKFFMRRGNINIKLKNLHAALQDYKKSCRMGYRSACRKLKDVSR
jgi:tetratricopeptide (TPR) repeat protein